MEGLVELKLERIICHPLNQDRINSAHQEWAGLRGPAATVYALWGFPFLSLFSPSSPSVDPIEPRRSICARIISQESFIYLYFKVKRENIWIKSTSWYIIKLGVILDLSHFFQAYLLFINKTNWLWFQNISWKLPCLNT